LSLDRAFRWTGLVGVALFFAIAFTPLAHALSLWMAVEPELVPSDAIVVLGATVSQSGILSAESTRRTNHAIELYQKGLAPRLILLGGTREGGVHEAEIQAKAARLHSIPAEAIITESRARTTREEAARVRDLARSRGIRTVLPVTNSGHMARARPVFRARRLRSSRRAVRHLLRARRAPGASGADARIATRTSRLALLPDRRIRVSAGGSHMIGIFMLALAALTSVAAYLLGVRRLGLEPARLGAAIGRMLETVGAVLIFLAANLLGAVVLVMALRGVTDRFVSIYVTDDAVWLSLALLQGLVFQWWRAVSGKKADRLLLEERGNLG